MVTKAQIDKVLKEYPTLHYSGFGVGDGVQGFYDNMHQIQLVVDLLKNVRKTKYLNRHMSSYGLKHWAERKPNPRSYVTNGSFIVGAILSGFNIEIKPPNAYFNMSKTDTK